MAITNEQQQNIIALTVGLFNAAPGADYLTELSEVFEANGNSYAALTDFIVSTPAFNAQYAGRVTVENKVATALNLLGVPAEGEAREEATAYFLERAEAGASEAEILLEAVQFLQGDVAEKYADIKAAFENKIEVATFYSVEQQQSSTNLEELKSVVANVTSDPATVEEAEDAIIGGTGQTFTLTDGIDNFVGTGGNDTFIGDNTSANAGDTLEGGAGTDTLQLFNSVALGNISGIENVEINGNTGNVNVSNNADVESVTLRNTDITGTDPVYTLAAEQTLTLRGVTDSTAAGDSVDVAAAGSVTEQTVNVNGVGDTSVGGNDVAVDINGTGVQTLNLDSSENASRISLVNTGNAVNTLNVAGNAALTVDANVPNATTINSTNTAGVALATAVATNTTAGLAIAMGEGSDSVTLAQANTANSLSSNTNVDLGAGDDTLSISLLQTADRIQAGAALAGGEGTDTLNVQYGAVINATTGAQFSGFEVVDLNGGQGIYNLANLEANNTVSSLAVSAALVGTTTVNNLAEGATVNIGAALTGGLTINQKDAGAGSPDDVLDVTVDARAGITTGGNLDINDIETVNLSVKGTGSTTTQTHTITTLTADEATKITIDASDANATIGSLVAESAVLVDASASAEDVSITTTDVFSATSGVSFKGGEGDDSIILTGATTAGTGVSFVVEGGAGSDAITLSTAETKEDQVVYSAQSDSSATDFDSITNFNTTEDKVDLSAFGFEGQADDAILTKAGAWANGISLNASGDIEVTDAVAGNFFNDVGIDRGVAVVDAGTDTYAFVDVNKDGDFSAAEDMVIKFVGIDADLNTQPVVGDFTFA